MSSPTVVDTFLSLIVKSELLSAEEVASTVKRFDLQQEISEEEVARRLVAGNILTRWQAARLLDGRSRGFFLDEYELLELLGVGGMGQLYVAEDDREHRKYALKVLADRHKEDRGMLTRLQFEARAGMRLKHPNIIRTLKLEKSKDVREIPYIVMDFIEGVSLDEYVVESGKCSWQQACDIIRQAAAGLHHAHENDVIHRDVKPANLLVDRAGKVHIIDFGLALIKGEDESEFSLTMIFGHDCVGTSDYMPPEQARDSRTVDRRADVFSLGCTFYSLISGDLPFGRTTARKGADGYLELKHSRTPPPIQKVCKDIPPRVAAIINKMMATSPEDRFQTADHVRRLLEPYTEQKPVDFDFLKILEKRRVRAEKRLAEQEKQRSSSKSLSTAAGYDQDTKPYQSPVPVLDVSESKIENSRPSIASLPNTAELVRTKLEDSKPSSLSTTQKVASLPPSGEPSAYLIPLDGAEPIPLHQDRILIGRKKHCDVRIDSPMVSGEHCELIHEGYWWTVRDLDSKNGVRLNGALVIEDALWPGSRITIAEQYHFIVNKRPQVTSFWSSWKPWAFGGLLLSAVVALVVYWLLYA